MDSWTINETTGKPEGTPTVDAVNRFNAAMEGYTGTNPVEMS